MDRQSSDWQLCEATEAVDLANDCASSLEGAPWDGTALDACMILPMLRALAASSSCTEPARSASPRGSSQHDQACRGAVAGKELLHSMLGDADELSIVEQWLGSAAEGAFEPIEPPWSAGGDVYCSEGSVPQATVKSRVAKTSDKATWAEKQKEFAARGSAAGKALLHSMLDGHSISSGSASVWSEEEDCGGSGLIGASSGGRPAVDPEAAFSETSVELVRSSPKRHIVYRRPPLLSQNLTCAPVERTSLLLLGSRGAVAAQRRRLYCRSSAAVSSCPVRTDCACVCVSRGRGWMQLAEKPVHLPTELPLQPWEPPDLQVEWETEDGNSAGTDGTCREQGHDRCSHAQVSASEPSVTTTQPLCLASQHDHPMEMVRAVYFAEDQGADKERREEGTHFQRSPTPLQRKRRRTPVARGGGGARAGGGVPSTALFRPAASGGVSCAGQHSHQSVHEHAHDREHQHGRAATKPCDDFAVAAVTAVHEQVVATDLGLVLESARENRGKEDFAQDEQVPPAQVQSARHGNVRTRRLVGKRWGSILDSDSDSDVQGADRGSVTVSPKAATTASQQPRVPLRPMDMHLNKVSHTAPTTSKEKKKKLEREEEEARAAAHKSVFTDTKLSRKLQVPSCGAAAIVTGDSASDNNDSYSGQRNRSVGIGSRDESEHARQPAEADAETETETAHAATSETLTRPTLLGMGATQNTARLHTAYSWPNLLCLAALSVHGRGCWITLGG